jgi:hypothetical protein
MNSALQAQKSRVQVQGSRLPFWLSGALKIEIHHDTVDGGNPAPVNRWFIPL